MIGHQINLLAPAGSAYSPGNYGYLALQDNGASALGVAMGTSAGANQCYNARSLTTEPGQNTSVTDKFNTRFGLYVSSASGLADDPAYPPDVNVRKGYLPQMSRQGQSSNYTADRCSLTRDASQTQARELPDDATWNGYVGNGDWRGSGNATLNSYFSINHPTYGAPPTALADATRYQLYQWEVARDTAVGGLDDVSLGAGNATQVGEVGRPYVTAGQGSHATCNRVTGTADRRIFYSAVVDCGQLAGGRTSGIVASGLAKLFLLKPFDGTTYKTELVSIALPSDPRSVVKDVVKLYR